jgi:hypothetical protein
VKESRLAYEGGEGIFLAKEKDLSIRGGAPPPQHQLPPLPSVKEEKAYPATEPAFHDLHPPALLPTGERLLFPSPLSHALDGSNFEKMSGAN